MSLVCDESLCHPRKDFFLTLYIFIYLFEFNIDNKIETIEINVLQLYLQIQQINELYSLEG